MYTLGISAFYHDSAAALLKDGEILIALEEERFSRIKHDNNFPLQAIRRCLSDTGITIEDTDAIVYYEKPLLKFERIIDMFTRTYPRSIRPFVRAMPEWLSKKINVEQIIRTRLGYQGPIHYTTHHRAHAAATFYTSSFSEAAVLAIDGVGEYETTTLWHGRNTNLTQLASLHFPHSLGLLYSTFTSFLGFQVNNDEYKVMGLAAYGKPTYTETIRTLIDLKEDGSFALDMRFFSFRESYRMWSDRLERVLGESRSPNEILTQRHKDIAASLQAVTEEIYLSILTHLHERTGAKHLCVSGGVALNSLANGKIIAHTPFEHVHIMGAAGDGGSAIGAALAHHHESANTRVRALTDLRIGTAYTDDSIEHMLKEYKCSYKLMETNEELITHATHALCDGSVIGWFQGRMEFGPRSLGTRSILADPRESRMKDRVNKVKRRESFRPFATAVLQEDVSAYFDVADGHHAPFMNFCHVVRTNARNVLGAVVHADDTTRIQTIDRSEDELLYKLIAAFKAQTGVPALLNTSFNVKGEPIVESPEQAIRTFQNSQIDHLYIGSFVVSK